VLKTLAPLCFVLMQLFSTTAQTADTSPSGNEKRIPYKGTNEGDSGVSVLRVVLGLGFVLAIGVGGVLLLRRYLPASYGGNSGSGVRKIELMEVYRLTPKLTLFLIKVKDQEILLAQSGDRVTRLTITDPVQGNHAHAEI
jgi:flagellar biogenesis protein FliO